MGSDSTGGGENRGGSSAPSTTRVAKRRDSNRGLRAVVEETIRKAEKVADAIESIRPPPPKPPRSA